MNNHFNFNAYSSRTIVGHVLFVLAALTIPVSSIAQQNFESGADDALLEGGYYYNWGVSDDASMALLQWQVFGLPEAGMDRIDVALGNEFIETKFVELYPYPGSSTAVLFLVDTGSSSTPEALGGYGESIVKMAMMADLHQSYALASFDTDVRMLSDEFGDGRKIDLVVRGLQSTKNSVNPARGLRQAIDILSMQDAYRKGLYIFSDNLARSSMPDVDALIDYANDNNVSVYCIGVIPAGQIENSSLMRLILLTGGMYIEAAGENRVIPPFFLLQPLIKLDSGGRVAIDLSERYKLLFGGDDVLSVLFTYGEGQTIIEIPVSVRGPTLAEFWNSEIITNKVTVALLIFSGIFLMVITAMLLFWRKGAHGTFAFLEEYSGRKNPFVLKRGKSTIGRVEGNALVLQDESVSAEHAVIQWGDDGVITLTDLESANGTFCNGQQISSLVLYDDAQIEMGQIRLLFRKISF